MVGPEGFDGAIIGIGSVATPDGDQEVLVYDIQRMVRILVDSEDMTLEEAQEFIHFNILGIYLGQPGPCFVQSLGSIFPQPGETIH
jgi:hypothetical protein